MCSKLNFLCSAHPHAQETNIPNMVGVEKIEAPTWERALRQRANAKQNRI
jgi:hypothetical protein